MPLNTIWIPLILKFVFLALTSPLNFRYVYSTVFLFFKEHLHSNGTSSWVSNKKDPWCSYPYATSLKVVSILAKVSLSSHSLLRQKSWHNPQFLSSSSLTSNLWASAKSVFQQPPFLSYLGYHNHFSAGFPASTLLPIILFYFFIIHNNLTI